MKNTQHHIRAFSQILSPNEIITAASDIAPFCLDQRKRYQGAAFAVLQPQSVAAVQAIMRYCHQHQIAVTPQGGNTSLCGGATPHAITKDQGIIVSLSRLNQMRHINLADNTITVDAGMILADVQQAAQRVNRYFPLSLASEGSCQIGGNIACNAGGLNVVRYGPMRQLVAGLEYVLANGELVSHLSPLHKNTTGYELYQQIIGSEGTLAIITGATLKLFAPPQSVLTAWLGLNEPATAIEALSVLKNHFGERLTSFELISDDALKLSARYSQQTLPTQAAWHVLLELTDSMSKVDLSESLYALLDQHQWLNTVIAQSETDRQHLWTLRENISAAQRQLGASIKHDIAMPITHIADFLAVTEQQLTAAFPEARLVVFGHLGDGSLHYNVFMGSVLSNDVYQYEAAINQLVYQQVLNHQGTIAAEHGIGQLKTHWLPLLRSKAELQWMQQQKQQLDPKGILNIGKVLPAIS
ncbi:FAD-binding oxidoreductase [Neisseriaceae bacterium ESL0693]|nr:FAD-binding oxidoreductase [Neisseriaceae bacterium ESL0693]